MANLVTTRPRGFVEYRPKGDAMALIEATQRVLVDYRDFLPLTLRQIYYRLVVANVIGKTERDYKRLGEVLNRARRGKMVSFDAIRDDGVTKSAPESFESYDDVVETYQRHAERLQIDRQRGQPRQLRVWCEAAGMVPQLERVAFEYGIPVYSSGGFDSTTIKHEVGRDLAGCGPLEVLHLGDFDPSGVHIFSSLYEDVSAFAAAYGGDVDFERIAVTPEQVAQYYLPTAPPKPTDRRSFSSTTTTQCEALDPETLADILRHAIIQRIDVDAYAVALDHEATVRVMVMDRLA